MRHIIVCRFHFAAVTKKKKRKIPVFLNDQKILGLFLKALIVKTVEYLKVCLMNSMTEHDWLQKEKEEKKTPVMSFLYKTVRIADIFGKRRKDFFSFFVVFHWFTFCCHCPFIFVCCPLLSVGGITTFTARDAVEQSLSIRLRTDL